MRGAEGCCCWRARQTTIVLGTLSNATRVFKNGVSQEIRKIESQGSRFWRFGLTIGGDVDFSQVMPLASGSRTKKMRLGASVMSSLKDVSMEDLTYPRAILHMIHSQPTRKVAGDG